MAIMNGITNSLKFLLVISIVLPTSAIMYASGQSTDNSDDSSTGGGTTTTTDNSGSSSGGSTDNSGSSTTGGGSTTTTDNSGSSTTGGGSTDNSATLPTTSTASNNTGNTQGMDVNGILAVHNQERAAVGLPPLTWSDSLAASAQTWADHLATLGLVCNFKHGCDAPPHGSPGENQIGGWLVDGKAGIADDIQKGWASEKVNYHGEVVTADNYNKFGHYTQMVWGKTKEVGCAFATDTTHADLYVGQPVSGNSYIVCHYYPVGNILGQKPY
jgi:hypothetical protein